MEIAQLIEQFFQYVDQRLFFTIVAAVLFAKLIWHTALTVASIITGSSHAVSRAVPAVAKEYPPAKKGY